MPVALDTFHAFGRLIVRGEELPATDEVVKKFPTLFSGVTRSVEQATAAPGEKRTRSRGK